jgi:hypothetical protein
MKTQKIIVISMISVINMLVLSSTTTVYAGQDCLHGYTQDYKDDTLDDNLCYNSDDMMYRALACDGYSDGYSQEYTQSKCDYAEDIFDDLFLPIDGYAYTQPDGAPPSRITVFFASLGVELLFAYCKVKAWLARHCCSKISQDISTDISIDTCDVYD